jgi:hypothetical protein
LNSGAESGPSSLRCRRNEAQIAYLRQPHIRTPKAFEAQKQLRQSLWKFSTCIRAQTVIGLKLKASYASTEAKLADSIVEDILQL